MSKEGRTPNNEVVLLTSLSPTIKNDTHAQLEVNVSKGNQLTEVSNNEGKCRS